MLLIATLHLQKKALKIVSIVVLLAVLIGSFTPVNAYDSENNHSDGSSNLLGNDYLAEDDGLRIQNGWWWTTNTINVFYGNGITSAMKEKIESALDKWSSVSLYNFSVEFTFVEVESQSQSQLYFIFDQTMTGTALGRTTPTDINGYEEGEANCIRGEIAKCKIAFAYPPNGGEYSFSDVIESGKHNFESVALHEIGHALGIAHCHTSCTSSCETNVMSSYFTAEMVRLSLQDYDKASLISCYCIYHPFS